MLIAHPATAACVLLKSGDDDDDADANAGRRRIEATKMTIIWFRDCPRSPCVPVIQDDPDID